VAFFLLYLLIRSIQFFHFGGRKGEWWWLKIHCVVCVGRRKSLTTICFSSAVLLGVFGVYALSDLECRSCLIMILCQTLFSSRWVSLQIRLMMCVVQFELGSEWNLKPQEFYHLQKGSDWCVRSVRNGASKGLVLDLCKISFYFVFLF